MGSLYGPLHPGGAVLYTEPLPRLYGVYPLTTVEAAQQLAAEVDDGLPATEFAMRLRYEYDWLRDAAKGANAIGVWAMRGTVYQIPGSQRVYERVDALTRHYWTLRHALGVSLRELVAAVDDPNLIVSAILPARLTDLIGLPTTRYGLHAGISTTQPNQEGLRMGKSAQRSAKESRRVIGADPGETTGLAYIRGHTILDTAAVRGQRELFQKLTEWVQSGDDAGEMVEGVGLERFSNLQFLSPERHTSLMAEGTIRTVAAILGVYIEDHTPEMITLYTRNKCSRLQEAFGTLPTTLHERDALAHALLFLQRAPTEESRLRARREKAVSR